METRVRELVMLLACSLAACATGGVTRGAASPAAAGTAPISSAEQAPTAGKSALRTHSLEELARLIYAPQDNPAQFCVSSAVRTQFALAVMKSGKAAPQAVHDALVGHLTDPKLISWREHQFAEWSRSQSAEATAVVLLEDCLPDVGVAFDFGKVAMTCLSFGSQPGAQALLSKGRGMSLKGAKERQRRLFEKSGLKVPLLDGVVEAVYQAPSGDSEYRVLEKLFGGCLEAMAR